MRIAKFGLGLIAAAALFGATPAFSASTAYTIGPVIDISASCSSQNAEVEQAVDQKLGYVYETWMGCRGIAFARSTDGGKTFAAPVSVPGSIGSNINTREPAVTGGPCGTVYYVVMQKSTDQGKTFGPMSYISPGFPASGGDSAPLVVEPNGRIDVLYQGYHITDTTTYAMEPAYEYFTASTDGGQTWSSPVRLGPDSGTMSLAEWWIDGAIAMDAAGDLYAVWDTQGQNNDVGWLSYSTDHGAHWSVPVQVPPDQLDVPHVMQVTGGAAGTAYVSFFSSADARGYADYLRAFTIKHGLAAPVQVSAEFGDTSVWPGDTFGLSTLSSGRVAVSWGSATPSSGKKSDIFAANVTVR